MKRARFRGKSARKTFSVLRWIYPAMGLALAGPALAVWIGLTRVFLSLPFNGMVAHSVLAGAGTYLIFHLLFRKPMTVYVFGHELTHAAAAFLSGYKVKSLFVSEKGGEVELSDSNVFVALAPYCVPLYAVMVLLAYVLVRQYAPLSSPPLWVGFGVGFTLAFHGALTIYSLRQDQPDLRHAGTFFSMVLIVLFNGMALLLVSKALFPSSVNVGNYFGVLGTDTRMLFDRLWEGFRWMRDGTLNVWEIH